MQGCIDKRFERHMKKNIFFIASTVSTSLLLSIPQISLASVSYLEQRETVEQISIDSQPSSRVNIARLSRGGEVTVDALAAVTRPDGSSAGGASFPIRIRVEKGRGSSVGVAFFESERDTIRTGMRASGWMAVTATSLLLGNGLGEYNISFDAESRNLDGPSAGGLFTVSVLSVLLGDDLRSDVTMTGTINPDGSIGSVGGIPQKLDGAKQVGKKVVLIPKGTRSLEVIAAERKLGVEVKEVGDIYEAYREFTGESLTRVSASANNVEISASDVNKIASETRKYHRQYQELRNTRNANPNLENEIAKAVTIDLFNTAEQYFSRSRNYLSGGGASGAYVTALESIAYLNASIEVAKKIELLEKSGVEDTIVSLQEDLQKSNNYMNQIFNLLSQTEPTTTGNAIALTKAYRELALGWANIQQATYHTQRLSQATSLEEKLFHTHSAASSTSFINLALQNAIPLMNIGFSNNEEGAAPPSLQELQAFSHNHLNSASANTGYFESLMQARWGISIDAVQQELYLTEPIYASAIRLQIIANNVDRENISEESKAYIKLAASLSSYNLSSLLVAKYYSLRVETDQNGKIINFDNQVALNEMLDFAEQRASNAITLSEQSGSNPVLQILEYEGAELLQRSTPIDQLTALWRFWNASAEADLATIFTGQPLAE